MTLEKLILDVPLDAETHTTPPHNGALSLHTSNAVVALRPDPNMPALDAAAILSRLISQAIVLRDQYVRKAEMDLPSVPEQRVGGRS